MAVDQQVKGTEITEQESLLLTRNILRIATLDISHIRGLFPEKYFNDKSVPALEMKIKKLMPLDAESRRLIDWMEKGKLVVQSEASNKKLVEVKELLDGKSMEIEIPNQALEFNVKDLQHNDHNMKDGSTYGGLHSIGSDLTRTQLTQGQSEAHKRKSIHSGKTYSGKAQDKISRKTRIVMKPIVQNLKRQKPLKHSDWLKNL